MQARPPRGDPAADRLGFALAIALAVHAGLILGVGFAVPDRDAPPPGLEVTLAQFASDTADPDADFVAQANQRGSGETEQSVEPRAPRAAALDAPQPREAAQPATPAPAPLPADAAVLTADSGDTAVPSAEAAPEDEAPGADAAAVPVLSREVSALLARLDEQARAYAQRPRIHRLTSVSAREAEDAAYLLAWTERVETVGNGNYPVEARKRRLYGDLRLLVAVRADGSVAEIRVLQSSGSRILDDAAVRIVRMSAPFDAFPPELRARHDVLEIIRTWQFRADRLHATS